MTTKKNILLLALTTLMFNASVASADQSSQMPDKRFSPNVQTVNPTTRFGTQKPKNDTINPFATSSDCSGRFCYCHGLKYTCDIFFAQKCKDEAVLIPDSGGVRRCNKL